MKILFIGQLAEGQTSRMRMEALAAIGYEIIPFNTQAGWSSASWLSRRIQKKLHRGSVITHLNQYLLTLAREHKPDLLWAEKQEYLQPETLHSIHKSGIRALHFTPDPYFTLSWKRTAIMDACMPLFDYVVTSKQYEIDEYKKRCQQVIYMPLGFSQAVHRPYLPTNSKLRDQFSCDVGFLGGWEPRREHLLNAILTQTKCKMNIWGYSWDHLRDGKWTLRRAYRLRLLAGDTKTPYQIKKNTLLADALRGGEVYGDQYAWALSGAKISVGFLRKVCPDQHTTRTFEIPACASLMLADRTEEHQAFFEEGVEAEFFSSSDELVDKVKFYLRNEMIREKIAQRGYQRSISSGYSYTERLEKVLVEMGL